MDITTLTDSESSATPVFIMHKQPINSKGKNWDLHSSPSSESKVSKWLYNNPIKTSDDQQLPTTTEFIFSESSPLKKSSIIIRQDYKKSPITNNIVNLNNSVSYSVRNMHNLVENLSNLCDSQHKSKSLSNFEMQKKSELCSYLKLNPSASQLKNIKQNRRSNRVKNLTAQLEQKELERRLNVESSESDKDRNIIDVKLTTTTNDRVVKKTSEFHRRSSLNEINIDAPPITLQVNEISTTSTTTFRKSSQSSRNVIPSKRKSRSLSHKLDTLSNASSYKQILNVSFASSALNVPNDKITNFDDCIELFVPKIKINYHHRENQKNKKLKKVLKPLSRIIARSSRFSSKVSNNQFRSLRSKKKLTRVKLQSLLLKERRKYKKHQRSMKGKNVPAKQFKSTELIQQGQIEGISKSNTSALKIVRSCGVEDELDSLKNLTPEHRKALIESKKFLDMDVSVCCKEVHVCLQMPAQQVNLETPTQLDEQVEVQSETAMPSPCSEDIEVDRLFNSRSDITEVSQSLNTISNEIVVREYLEKDCLHSGSSSTSSSSSNNSCSMETVASVPEPTNNNLELPFTNDINKELPEVINVSQIEPSNCEYIPLSGENKTDSLNRCLTLAKSKRKGNFSRGNLSDNQQNWIEDFETDDENLRGHFIYLSSEQGAIIGVFYINFFLIIVQEKEISFWNRSPLGNIIDSHDMWFARGSTSRLVLGNGCVSKRSPEMMISVKHATAFVELWIKEHKSDKRERPVADIFVAIYFRLNRDNPLKKVVQLENINGYATDVQYVVLRNYQSIVVSWSTLSDYVTSTLVHHYILSPDFQKVVSIEEMQTVQHYVSSLHSLQDCNNIVMGYGDNKLTFWNIDHGYTVATVELDFINELPNFLWVKSDRGFIFTLHNFNNGQIYLIGIDSFTCTWKQLQNYNPGPNHTKLLGAFLENGFVMAFYETGILCWKAKTGQLIMDDPCEDLILPVGNHVIVVLENQIIIRHALEYLVDQY